MAGIQPNLGKTRCWGAGDRSVPAGLTNLGAEVWRGDKIAIEAGLRMLGSPIGTADYIHSWCAKRARFHNWTLEQISHVQDSQCRWLLLKFCAEPMANHALRNIPPSLVMPLAENHDAHLWTSTLALFNLHD
eukprot:7514711-Karenia_brevis.AAC.1